jgi:hypothetical protein
LSDLLIWIYCSVLPEELDPAIFSYAANFVQWYRCCQIGSTRLVVRGNALRYR